MIRLIIMDPTAGIEALKRQLREAVTLIATKNDAITDLTKKLQAMEMQPSAMQRRIFW